MNKFNHIKLKFSIVVLVLFISCRSYKPFESRKEYKTYNTLIQANFELDKDYNNEIIYEISSSLKDSIEYSSIQRRIYSLNSGAFDELKFIAFMRLDRLLKKYDWKITETPISGLEYKEIKSLEELEAYLKTLDSILSSSINIKMDRKVNP